MQKKKLPRILAERISARKIKRDKITRAAIAIENCSRARRKTL